MIAIAQAPKQYGFLCACTKEASCYDLIWGAFWIVFWTFLVPSVLPAWASTERQEITDRESKKVSERFATRSLQEAKQR
jgi:hypothetical protein